jgi:hypothetical protein
VSEREPDQEELARQLAEELRRLTVQDVLVNTLLTVSSIGYRRLGASAETREDRDLEQARLAIETMRALTPVLEKFVPDELIRDCNQSVAKLQLAYAQVASEPAAAARPTGGQTAPTAGESVASDDDPTGKERPSAESAERRESETNDDDAVE